MKFRLSALLLTALLALSMALPAWADVLDVPPNDFFVEHEEECEYDHRLYYANSPKGYVNFREAPGGRVIRQEENGVRLLSNARYQDWVFVEYYGDTYWDAWVPLSELSVVYDEISFAEEYSDQFTPCDREQVEALLSDREDGYVVYWDYPNAERARYVQWEEAEVFARMADHITDLYTDPEGCVWALGCQLDYWVCLSAPEAGDGQMEYDRPDGTAAPYPRPRVVSVREAPPIKFYPAREPVPPLSNYLPAGLVGGAVALSAAALWFFYRKKPAKGDSP